MQHDPDDPNDIANRLDDWAAERAADKPGPILAREAASVIRQLRMELGALTAARTVLGQSARARWDLDMPIDFPEPLFALCDILGDPADPSPVHLRVGVGHSGYGLYASSVEHPDRGSTKLFDIDPPAGDKPV